MQKSVAKRRKFVMKTMITYESYIAKVKHRVTYQMEHVQCASAIAFPAATPDAQAH